MTQSISCSCRLKLKIYIKQTLKYIKQQRFLFYFLMFYFKIRFPLSLHCIVYHYKVAFHHRNGAVQVLTFPQIWSLFFIIINENIGIPFILFLVDFWFLVFLSIFRNMYQKRKKIYYDSFVAPNPTFALTPVK